MYTGPHLGTRCISHQASHSIPLDVSVIHVTVLVDMQHSRWIMDTHAFHQTIVI